MRPGGRLIMSDLGVKRSWVERVLGITFAQPRAFSLVALGKSRLAWRNDRLSAIAEIGRLQSALAQEFGPIEEQKDALQSALKRLDTLIGELSGVLDDNLDAVLNAAEPSERQKRIAESKSTLTRFETLILSDSVMAELDGNEVLPDMEVTAPLRRRLNEINAALGAGG